MTTLKLRTIAPAQLDQACSDLVAAAGTGDRAGVELAMETLAPALEARLRRHASAAVQCNRIRYLETQDVIAEVILRVFDDPPRSCPHLSPRESVFRYARTILRNLLQEIAGRTRARREFRRTVDIDAPDLATHLASPDASAEERAIAREELSLAVDLAGSAGLAELKDLAVGESGGVYARARGIARGTAYNRRTALRTALRASPEFAHRRAERRRPRLAHRGE
jgi:DNA-directed RNA polymerase specialized sigma24 family protein